jgi:Zn-dependent metalloprotease
MLKNIAEQGTAEQRDIALRTITESEKFRGHRRAIREVLSFTAASALSQGKNRSIYDAKNGRDLPGILVRSEGDAPVGDMAVDEAYDGSGITYDLYSEVYGRDSIDGNGLPLKSTVHYQKGYDNAFWNGEQMVYGDGDEDLPEPQRLFNRFTIALDIIAHELTHGVTQYEANLAYWDQSGALNESMSDVFGSLVKQYLRQQTASDADWIIGEGLFTSNVNGVGIRSMKSPGTAYDDPVLGKDPQPGHMDDYVKTIDDNGGVHINSGIPNHAFYVTALTLGGFAWEKAGMIWYQTLTEKLSERNTFQQAADLTFEAAGELYGTGSMEQNAVRTGWAEVGISIGGDAPTGCLPGLLRAIGLSS